MRVLDQSKHVCLLLGRPAVLPGPQLQDVSRACPDLWLRSRQGAFIDLFAQAPPLTAALRSHCCGRRRRILHRPVLLHTGRSEPHTRVACVRMPRANMVYPPAIPRGAAGALSVAPQNLPALPVA